MKKNWIYIFLLLFIGLIIALKCNSQDENNCQQNTNKKYINIIVHNSIIKKINTDNNFIGVNFFGDSALNSYFFKSPLSFQKLGKLLNKLHIDSIRYPSGMDVVVAFWDVPYMDILEAIKKLPQWERGFHADRHFRADSRIDFFTFIKFCKDNNLKTTIQVNTHSIFDKKDREIILLKSYDRDIRGYRIWNTGVMNKENWKLVDKAADYAAAQVKWVKDNGYSDTVKYWELGNEEYSKSFLNAAYTGAEYGKVAAIFIKKMKAVDPNIKILITGFAVPPGSKNLSKGLDVDFLNDWTEQLLNTPELKQCKNDVYAITSHIYCWANSKEDNTYSIFRNNILNNSNLNTEERNDYQEKMLKNAGFFHTKIFMNEFNPNYMENPYSHTWLGALGTGKMILSCANNKDCEHGDYHALMHHFGGINKGFGAIHFAALFPYDPFICYPVTSIISLLNENLHGNIIKADFDKSDIFVTAVQDKNYVKVIILNMEKDRKTAIDLNEFPDLKYLENKSVGINIPEDFTVMDTNDDFSNPAEVRVINTLDNALEVKFINNKYQVNLPANTLSVIKFQLSY